MLAPGDGMPASIPSRSRLGSSPRCRAMPCLVDGMDPSTVTTASPRGCCIHLPPDPAQQDLAVGVWRGPVHNGTAGSPL